MSYKIEKDLSISDNDSHFFLEPQGPREAGLGTMVLHSYVSDGVQTEKGFDFGFEICEGEIDPSHKSRMILFR